MFSLEKDELIDINAGGLGGAFIGGFVGFVVGAVGGGFAGIYYKDFNVTKDWMVTCTFTGICTGSVAGPV